MSSAAMKLYYFGGLLARGEVINMILSYKNIPNESVSLSPEEFWKLKKENFFTYGQVPVMEVNGSMIPESGAIVRYLATQYDFIPKDSVQAAICDSLYESSQDLQTGGVPKKNINLIANRLKGDELKSAMEGFFEVLPPYLDSWTKTLGSQKFFCGNEPCYGDFGVFHVLSLSVGIKPDCLDAHESLKVFMKNVSELPAIKTYLEKRPVQRDIQNALTQQ
eukprot:TRINITY_DN13074_c0_g3_i1.p2 TRINITY_DN13074_c0_g3~~TRINITY_DN13074_c0_g3_i1.p2  ORF type:complete len:220 (-),score=26.27 TRINITY_DN13074_c0_g3_i1:579-1238(-)